MKKRTKQPQHYKHMAMTKRLACMLVESQDDWHNFFQDWKGTREELLAALRSGPSLLGPDSCDNFDGEKGCLGHTR